MTQLSPQSRNVLLHVAREAIKATCTGGAQAAVPDSDDPSLAVEAGAFVSLHKRGELRGCIGTFRPRGSVVRTVADMARAAAFEDTRFRPLTAEELPDVDLEISVLTPMRRIADVTEIEVGRHGLWVAQGHRRGVLLPQVATCCGWGRETFLEQTCLKAGLPRDAWRRGAEIYVFEAEVFGEKEKTSPTPHPSG